MLPSQRALFDLPRDVCYLNAAGWSPLPLAVQEAGRAGVGRKGRPWELAPDFAAGQHERARAAAARLIGADPGDVALIPSVGYGVAAAAKALGPLPAGSRVLVLEDDHSSPVLEWVTRAPAEGFAVETVRRPADGDWTAALAEAIERPGAPPVAVASVSSVHWSDGGALALEGTARTLRARGAALVVDATHEVGVLPTDVRTLDPDFLVFPTYKWTLGPYGRAFLYVAPRRQSEGVPLEQTSHGRRGVSAERVPYFADLSFAPGARRFDMGERDHFVSLEMASVGMEMMAAWGADAVRERLRMLTGRIADALRDAPEVRIADVRVRAPHLLCLEFPGGMPDGLVGRLAAENVHAAPRVGRLRLSPHVYNDEEDADRFVAALLRAVR